MQQLITGIFLITSLLTTISCSQETWYKGSKTSHDIRCLQKSSSDYDECINENRPDFDEYKQATDQLEKDSKIKP